MVYWEINLSSGDIFVYPYGDVFVDGQPGKSISFVGDG